MVRYEFDKRLRLDDFEKSSTIMEILELKRFCEFMLPFDYMEFVRKFTDAEINIDNEMYIRIWGAVDCIKLTEAYNLRKYISDGLFFGDDEGGNGLAFMNGLKGFGIYKIDFGNICVEDSIFLSNSLKNILEKGEGIDKLKY